MSAPSPRQPLLLLVHNGLTVRGQPPSILQWHSLETNHLPHESHAATGRQRLVPRDVMNKLREQFDQLFGPSYIHTGDDAVCLEWCYTPSTDGYDKYCSMQGRTCSAPDQTCLRCAFHLCEYHFGVHRKTRVLPAFTINSLLIQLDDGLERASKLPYSKRIQGNQPPIRIRVVKPPSFPDGGAPRLSFPLLRLSSAAEVGPR